MVALIKKNHFQYSNLLSFRRYTSSACVIYFTVCGLKSNNLVIRFCFLRKGERAAGERREGERDGGGVVRRENNVERPSCMYVMCSKRSCRDRHHRPKCNYVIGFLYGIIIIIMHR